MTGATIAQAIPIAISPILARVYSPKDFGMLSVFASLATIFGTVATLRYELAIMLPESEDDALNVGAIGVLTSIVLSLFLLAIAFFFNTPISELLANKKVDPEAIAPWLYFVPISVFFVGLYNVLNYISNRRKDYRDIAAAGVHRSVVLAATQLSVGLVQQGALGLIVGRILSGIAAIILLLKKALSIKDIGSRIHIAQMKTIGYRYRDFPLFSMPAALSNTSATNVTNVLVSAFYSPTTLGFYSMTQRILGMPSVLIGRAVSQVFFQQATEEKNKTGVSIKTFDKTVNKLALIAIPGFAVIFIVVEDVFAFVFSEKWRISGTYARYLVPLFAIRFVVSTVSLTNIVFEKQKLGLAWQVGLLVLTLGSICYANYASYSFEQFLILYMAVCVAHYLLYYFILRAVAMGKL